jgi:copper(I)-binding protein
MQTIRHYASFRPLLHIALLIVAPLFFSHASYANNIQVQHPRINPTIEGIRVSAVYFDIVNNSNEATTLVSVTGEISERIEIHQHAMVDGLMKMQKVSEGIHLPAQQMVVFKPAGYHIMIMNLQQAINEGDIVELKLHFDNGSSTTISARAIKASAKPHHHNSHY